MSTSIPDRPQKKSRNKHTAETVVASVVPASVAPEFVNSGVYDAISACVLAVPSSNSGDVEKQEEQEEQSTGRVPQWEGRGRGGDHDGDEVELIELEHKQPTVVVVQREAEDRIPAIKEYDLYCSTRLKRYTYYDQCTYDMDAPRNMWPGPCPVNIVLPDGTQEQRFTGPYGNVLWSDHTLGGSYTPDPKVARANVKLKNFMSNDATAKRKLGLGRRVPDGGTMAADGNSAEMHRWIRWQRDIIARDLHHHHRHKSIFWKALVGKSVTCDSTDVWSTVLSLADADLLSESLLVTLGLSDSLYAIRFVASADVFANRTDGPPLEMTAEKSQLCISAAKMGVTLNLPKVSKVANDGIRYNGDHFYGAACYKQKRFGGLLEDTVDAEESTLDKRLRLGSCRLDEAAVRKNDSVIPGITMQARIDRDNKCTYDTTLQNIYHVTRGRAPEFRCDEY
jgi:hypothetical protein